MRRKLQLSLLMAAFWSGGAGVTYAACSPLPYSLANGQVADATQLMADLNALTVCPNSGPAGAANAIQYNAGGGNLAGVGPLNDGQIVVGATGGPPQATTITAGSGISIINAPGSVTIAASATANVAQREFGPFAPPTAATFTFIDLLPVFRPLIA